MEVIILAAGKGTRMFSNKPKVLHTIAGIPMLEHVLDSALALGPSKVHVVVGYGSDEIYSYFGKTQSGQKILWALQEEQLGTAHAVQQACSAIDADADDNQVLVLYGDVPLIQPDTLRKLLSGANDTNISLITLTTNNNKGLGRILRNESGEVTGIIEERDADKAQREITEVNSGIMAIPAERLKSWLDRVKNTNKQSEYYLTDVVGLAVADGYEVNTVTTADTLEVQGVNDKAQLALMERHYQMRNNNKLLEQGVTMSDPGRVDVRGTLNCGKDVTIDVNVIFEGAVNLGDNVTIAPNVIIKNSTIAEGSNILAGSIIEDSKIGRETNIGPYARVRPGTIIKNKAKVGNFVEIKKSILGEGTKANHLAYIGDAEIGDNCNIGAGTIFCNYDGANKHKTILGDNVFIGSNSVLVAPIKLSDNAFVAAGSTVNVDVPEEHLAVGRAKQRNVSGWKRPVKKTGE